MSNRSANVCILNCIEDVQDFLAEFDDSASNWTILSTHGAVNEYLRTLKIESIELASLLAHEDILTILKISDRTIGNVLCQLDDQWAVNISRILELPPINYFRPLYQYWAKLEYGAILKLIKALEFVFSANCIEKVLVYQSVKANFFEGDDIVLSVVHLLSESHSFKVEVRKLTVHPPLVKDSIFQLGMKIIQNPYMAYQQLKKSYLKNVAFQSSTNRKTVLLLGELYDLQFLLTKLSKQFNLLLWPAVGCPTNFVLDTTLNSDTFDEIYALDLMQDLVIDSHDIGLSILLKNLSHDFNHRLEECLKPVVLLDRFWDKSQVDAGVWGHAPVTGSSAIIADYLLHRDIPVFGMQHGASYGVQDNLFVHFDSDFSRCTHYFSYGFTHDDLQQTYPNQTVNCEIIPIGSYKEHHQKKYWFGKRETIDVLFPLTISLPFTLDGVRLKPDLLTIYQHALLQTLENLDDLRIVIKPMLGYSDKNCSIIETLKRLRHGEIIDHISFLRCLRTYNVRAVVFEYPSTPLYEAIGRDVEIFTMADPILPFNPTARQLLEKRVHYFEDITKMQAALIKWSKGELPTLRDDGFYRNHVFRENTPQLILQTIEKLSSAEG